MDILPGKHDGALEGLCVAGTAYRHHRLDLLLGRLPVVGADLLLEAHLQVEVLLELLTPEVGQAIVDLTRSATISRRRSIVHHGAILQEDQATLLQLLVRLPLELDVGFRLVDELHVGRVAQHVESIAASLGGKSQQLLGHQTGSGIDLSIHKVGVDGDGLGIGARSSWRSRTSAIRWRGIGQIDADSGGDLSAGEECVHGLGAVDLEGIRKDIYEQFSLENVLRTL